MKTPYQDPDEIVKKRPFNHGIESIWGVYESDMYRPWAFAAVVCLPRVHI